MALTLDLSKCCWKDGKCSSGGCGCESGGSCNGCAEVCAMGVFTRGQTLEMDLSKCIECGACISACPHQALSL